MKMNFAPEPLLYMHFKLSVKRKIGQTHQNNIQKKMMTDFPHAFSYDNPVGSKTKHDDYVITNLPKTMPKLPKNTVLRHIQTYPVSWPDIMILPNDGLLDNKSVKTKLIEQVIEEQPVTMSKTERDMREKDLSKLPNPKKKKLIEQPMSKVQSAVPIQIINDDDNTFEKDQTVVMENPNSEQNQLNEIAKDSKDDFLVKQLLQRNFITDGNDLSTLSIESLIPDTVFNEIMTRDDLQSSILSQESVLQKIFNHLNLLPTGSAYTNSVNKASFYSYIISYLINKMTIDDYNKLDDFVDAIEAKISL